MRHNKNINKLIANGAISLQQENKALRESLNVMTQLCRLKYGNLDELVYPEILKAEALLNKGD